MPSSRIFIAGMRCASTDVMARRGMWACETSIRGRLAAHWKPAVAAPRDEPGHASLRSRARATTARSGGPALPPPPEECYGGCLGPRSSAGRDRPSTASSVPACAVGALRRWTVACAGRSEVRWRPWKRPSGIVACDQCCRGRLNSHWRLRPCLLGRECPLVTSGRGRVARARRSDGRRRWRPRTRGNAPHRSPRGRGSPRCVPAGS